MTRRKAKHKASRAGKKKVDEPCGTPIVIPLDGSQAARKLIAMLNEKASIYTPKEYVIPAIYNNPVRQIRPSDRVVVNTFDSVSEACRHMQGRSPNMIASACNNQYHAHGFLWEWANDPKV